MSVRGVTMSHLIAKRDTLGQIGTPSRQGSIRLGQLVQRLANHFAFAFGFRTNAPSHPVQVIAAGPLIQEQQRRIIAPPIRCTLAGRPMIERASSGSRYVASRCRAFLAEIANTRMNCLE